MTSRTSGPLRPGVRKPGFVKAGLPQGRRGFTLIELLVVLSIQGILLAAVVTSFTGQLTTHDLQEQLNAMQQNARAAMTLVIRDARTAGYDPADAGVTGLVYDPDRLIITADHNGDGDLSDSNERVVYFHDSNRLVLRRDTGGGGQPLAEDVQGFTVEFLDAAGNATTVTSRIRQLRISVTTRTGKRDPRYPRNGGYRTHTLRSVVTPANLGL